MTAYIKSVEKLINEFRKLPGIGPKSARRIVFYLLKLTREEILEFSKALVEMKDKVRFCSICFNLSEGEMCSICSDATRDRKKICVVQNVSDVTVIEATGEYKGLYYVLGGLLSPIEDIGPEEIRIPGLVKRVESEGIEEVILALNPTVEGEGTAMYLKKVLQPTGTRITRLASGLPVGGDLEYVDELTVGKALSNRREI
ncbi:MAG: recombination protein RecR [Actinobacteria bacterium]|nr:recombination protein RecR [Actinomycetota bacterium]